MTNRQMQFKRIEEIRSLKKDVDVSGVISQFESPKFSMSNQYEEVSYGE
jgi:hypothetical protein